MARNRAEWASGNVSPVPEQLSLRAGLRRGAVDVRVHAQVAERAGQDSHRGRAGPGAVSESPVVIAALPGREAADDQPDDKKRRSGCMSLPALSSALKRKEPIRDNDQAIVLASYRAYQVGRWRLFPGKLDAGSSGVRPADRWHALAGLQPGRSCGIRSVRRLTGFRPALSVSSPTALGRRLRLFSGEYSSQLP